MLLAHIGFKMETNVICHGDKKRCGVQVYTKCLVLYGKLYEGK